MISTCFAMAAFAKSWRRESAVYSLTRRSQLTLRLRLSKK